MTELNVLKQYYGPILCNTEVICNDCGSVLHQRITGTDFYGCDECDSWTSNVSVRRSEFKIFAENVA